MSDFVENKAEDLKKKRSNKKRERQLSDIRFILKTPEGRRFYWRLMAEGQIFGDPFCNDNTNGTNYNLGRQSVSRTFLNDLLEAKPEAYQQMQQEYAALVESDKSDDEVNKKLSGDLV